MQFLVQDVLSRQNRNIVHTCWCKTQKILWEKNIFFEFLRYLHNVKYCGLNQYIHEILRQKWFLTNFRNLCNFSNFDYIFEIIFFWDWITVKQLLKEWRYPSKKVGERNNFFGGPGGKVHSFPKPSWLYMYTCGETTIALGVVSLQILLHKPTKWDSSFATKMYKQPIKNPERSA